MNGMKKLSAVAILASALSGAGAAVGASVERGPSVRACCERAAAGERLTVAFFGGSLTWGANATDPNRTSWRARIGARLEATYPKAHFKFVDAAIGGTGSSLGIFRLERDVLTYSPDLVFIDWTVNDDIRYANDDASSSYEGILRGLLARLPNCIPVPVILPDRRTVTTATETELKRRAEHLAVAKAVNLWPAVIGDNTHPFDGGYALYAEIIWAQIFANPSDLSPSVPADWLFAPKYRHVVRANLHGRDDLPKGWTCEPCAMRAGTFDFLCSRWQDGLAVAREGAAPLKARFRGEVLLIYGESAEQSAVAEVLVDGKLVSTWDTAGFGKKFPPSAWLVWPVGSALDPTVGQTWGSRGVFTPGDKRELRLGSICVAGRDAAVVKFVR